MTPRLQFFSEPDCLRRVQRPMLTRLLEDFKHCLPLDAVALLSAQLGHEEWCAAWAAQFSSLGAFGAPLVDALSAIETLSLPQNRSLLEGAFSQLPPGYEINRNFPALQQALHLWLIAQNTPGVTWPMRSAECPSSAPLGAVLWRADGGRNRPEDGPSACSPCASATDAGPEISGSKSEVRPGADESKIEIQNSHSQIDSGNPALEESSAVHNLAMLSATDYDRIRKAEAKRLRLRLATLDEQVALCQDRIKEAEAEQNFQNATQPWPQPITDAPALFDAVHARFVAYAYSPPGAPVVCTTFLGHAHAFAAFHYTPRINILSAKETCGKSTLVKVLSSMAPKPFHAQNLRPPVVYRIIDKHQPTLFLDEVETFLPLYRELLGLLNAGNSRDGCVPRCEGNDVRTYKVFAPVVLAGIGDLFRTLRSRSILIHVTEAPEDVQLTRFDSEHLEIEKVLRQQLARWAADNLKAIAHCDPPLPKGARNRVADNWRPLFQIAHAVGGHWPQLVTDAFHGLNPAPTSSHTASPTEDRNTKTPQDPSTDITALLLSDIRSIFAQTTASRLSSAQLVAALRALPGRPWHSLFNGKGVTMRWLALHLQPFGIRPKALAVDGTIAKGYLREDFLPSPKSPAPTGPADSDPRV